jgi:hypothetical protein
VKLRDTTIRSKLLRMTDPFRPRFRSARWRLALVGAVVAWPNASAHAQGGMAALHRVAGVVHDSIAEAPLRGALVQLVARNDPGWARTATSGPDGRFVIDSVPPGAYALGYLHPRLDSMHVVPPARTVQLPGPDSSVLLAVPSFATLARAACPDSPLADDDALFVGRLWPARAGAPVSAGIVSVQWSETLIDGGVQQRRPVITAETDAQGAFVICGVPVATRALVQGVSADGASGLVELQAPTSRLLLRDLRTAPVDRVITAASTPEPIADSADAVIDSITQLRGVGRLRGAIRTEDGTAIANAQLQVRETVAVARSSADGSFDLRELPIGTHTLHARAIGYAPLRQAVDISDGDTARIVFIMTSADRTLDTVRVLGERPVPYWKREFEGRRQQGMGRFIDEAAIARRNPSRVTDLLASLPNITIRDGNFVSQSQLLIRTTGGGLCVPDVMVDGLLVDITSMGVDSFVPASRLVGVEIYRSNVLRPIELPRLRGCGLIVLWTGDRETPPA